jgi:hypothetical protein
MTEFKPWPKIARLNRDITITEKIDGTNAAVIVTEEGEVAAQSRTRIITPDADNFGFARWVAEHAETLVDLLGPGRHFGEWWGQGIQRRYGLTEKRFSLFNTARYGEHDFATFPQVGIVPVLYCGPFDMSTPDPLTKLQQVAQRNGNGPRVPRLPADRQAIADEAAARILRLAAPGRHRNTAPIPINGNSAPSSSSTPRTASRSMRLSGSRDVATA